MMQEKSFCFHEDLNETHCRDFQVDHLKFKMHPVLFLTPVLHQKNWITRHKRQMRSLFSCKFVDLRFCRWRPDISSPWCSSSSPPSSLFAPAAQNTPAWPAPQSRRKIFCQTCKNTPMGHDFHHFISHVAKETLQNPNQIKPSGHITPNAFKTTASSVHPLWHHHI